MEDEKGNPFNQGKGTTAYIYKLRPISVEDHRPEFPQMQWLNSLFHLNFGTYIYIYIKETNNGRTIL